VIRSMVVVGLLTAACPPESPPGASAQAPKESKEDPGKVDDAFIAAIQAGRYADAYARMTSGYRATVPFADFEHAVKNNAYLKGSKLIGCGALQTYHRGVHVRRDCIMRSSAGNVYTELYYAMDEGEWRMTGIMLGGTPALPGVASRQSEQATAAEAPR